MIEKSFYNGSRKIFDSEKLNEDQLDNVVGGMSPEFIQNVKAAFDAAPNAPINLAKFLHEKFFVIK